MASAVDRRTFLRHAAAGACFSPDGRVLFVNQQGVGRAIPGVTYAIWGPWARGVH